MALKLRERVFQLLKQNPEQRFKAREIAEWIHVNFPDETAEKIEKSSFLTDENSLLYQLVAEIGSNRPQWQKKYPNLRTTEGRPRKFYWTEKTESEEVEAAENDTQEINSIVFGNTQFAEKDLYPKLSEFLLTEFEAKGTRIDESKASNRRGRGGNKWLYPDVVAVEALTKNLNAEVVEALKHSGDQRARLWSFEVKKLLNKANVREAYFQSVSNSSWANFGYLVAAQIEGSETMKEIQMLYAVHGIGLIELDPDSPTESTVRIPAREKPNVEWSMCSRLADENSDFEQFMKRVRKFFQTNDL